MGCPLTKFPLRVRASQYKIIALLGCVCVFLILVARADAQSNAALDLLARINRERVSRGLAPYALNASLTTAAQNHANDAVRTGKYGHVGSDGSMAMDRAARAGYGAYSWGRRIGENWANYHDVASAMTMWMDSAPHRANILHALYREIGIGVVPTPVGTTMYVLVFGAQPNVLPVFINDGATRTNELNVRLTLTTEDVAASGDGTSIGKPTLVQISNVANFAGATWQPFASSLKWTLDEDDTNKTVYVKYRDAKGRTATSSATIGFGAVSQSSTALRAPVAQITATTTRAVTSTPLPSVTLTRTATRGSTLFAPTVPVTSAATATSTSTPSPTPTEMATETPTPTVAATTTSTPQAIVATPSASASVTQESPSPIVLGAYIGSLLVSVIAIANRLAAK